MVFFWAKESNTRYYLLRGLLIIPTLAYIRIYHDTHPQKGTICTTFMALDVHSNNQQSFVIISISVAPKYTLYVSG